MVVDCAAFTSCLGFVSGLGVVTLGNSKPVHDPDDRGHGGGDDGRPAVGTEVESRHREPVVGDRPEQW